MLSVPQSPSRVRKPNRRPRVIVPADELAARRFRRAFLRAPAPPRLSVVRPS